MQNSFNLALVFGPGTAVATIVCHSEDDLDREAIMRVASTRLQASAMDGMNAERLVSNIVSDIKQECGCDVVVVKADVAAMVQRIK